MFGTHDLIMFVIAGLLLNITPGADTLYIVGRSASQGPRAGAVAALGISAGCFVHVSAAAGCRRCSRLRRSASPSSSTSARPTSSTLESR